MPTDDFYWNAMMDYEEGFASKADIDPWDLENYLYIKEHLMPREHRTISPEAIYYGKDQNYADIDEVKGAHRRHNHSPYSRLGDDYDYAHVIYEENKKRKFYDFKDRYNRTSSTKRERRPSQSFSSDLGMMRVDDVVSSRRRDSTLPIYTENNSRRFVQPKNFGLSSYGHLKIDYSSSWNNLNDYIYN